MLGNLHLLAHLILEVNAYSTIPLFSPSEKLKKPKKLLWQVWNSNCFFFFNEKARQKYYSVKDHKHHIIPQPQWLSTALRMKSKIVHRATVLPQFSQPSRLLPTWRPLHSVPRSVCNLFLSLLQTNSDSPLQFPLSSHFPGNVCLPSWACVTVSLYPNTSEELKAQLLPYWTQEGCPAWWWPFLPILWSQRPSKISLKNEKVKRTSLRFWKVFAFSLPLKCIPRRSKTWSSSWDENMRYRVPVGT